MWLVSCASVSDHYSFQCLKALSFGYFVCGKIRTPYHKTSREKRALIQTWLLNAFNVLDIIMNLQHGSTPWFDPEKTFPIKSRTNTTKIIDIIALSTFPILKFQS